MMDFKLLGSILLIVGTSIGAGMLALPIATAQLGFAGSLLLLFVCWIVMTLGAFLILEVNLWLPQNSNLITMAKITLGPLGQLIAWITYLLLLYSLLCAYIAGGSDLFHHLFLARHIDVPRWVSSVCFTILFGAVVYRGIRTVDYVNRGLMFVKLGSYILLSALLLPLISGTYLEQSHWEYLTSSTALTITVASFGYATIVPSLRIYFAGDVKKLKFVILIGGLIPLICYIIWDAVIMGMIPLPGSHGLMAILKSQNSTSDLVTTLSTISNHAAVSLFAKLFTSICVLTSFLGVSLCLTDFFADGLQLEKVGKNQLIIHLITYLPPLFIVLFFPNAFIKALEYAGLYSIVLLILLPAFMAWRGRYQKNIAKGFRVPGGKFILIILILFGLGIIIRGAM